MRAKIVASLLLLSELALHASAQPAPDIDLKKISDTAAKTKADLDKQGAYWVTRLDLHTGVILYTENTVLGNSRRVVFRGERDGKLTTLCILIMRDGFWYVQMGNRFTKYKPYEADLAAVTLYFMLEYAPLRFAQPGMQGTQGTLHRIDASHVEVRIPVPDGTRKPLEDLIRQAEAMIAQNPKEASNDETKKTITQLKELLDKGSTIRLDEANGQVTRQLTAKMTLEFSPIRLLNQKPEGAFDIDPKQYIDQTAPITNKPDDLVMIWHVEGWRPPQETPDPELVLLDITTGKWRRVPVAAVSAGAGCFSPDRRSVYIWTNDAERGGFSTREVVLASGENRSLPVGAGTFTEMNAFPVLSPDGKKLALLHGEVASRLLDSRLLILDLKTKEEFLIGNWVSRSAVDWLDNKSWVFELREPADFSAPGAATKPDNKRIATMDAQGKIATLLPGNTPVVVNDGKAILFQDPNEQWKLCDPDGKNVRVVADGLPKHQFPSPAPDGNRVIMMKFTSEGPKPVILTLSTGKTAPVPVGEGFWAKPAWK